MGNIFARRPGRNPDAQPVMTGSHLDSQPTGGKYDGAYGVLAGLEVVRTLNDLGVETEAPVEVAVWTNEEGSRFAPAMVASGVFAGAFDLEHGLSRPDPEGPHARRRTGAHRLCRRPGMRQPGTRGLLRGPHRAGSDPGRRGEDHRSRVRRSGTALVRDHHDRTGSARRPDTPCSPAGTRCSARRGP